MKKLIVAMLLLLSTSAIAFQLKITRYGHNLYRDSFVVYVEPGVEAHDALWRAYLAWQPYLSHEMPFRFTDDPGVANLYVSLQPTTDPDILATTESTFNEQSGFIFQSEMILHTLEYYVVLHEMGHAMGLGHSDEMGSVMYKSTMSDTISPDDAAAAAALPAEPREFVDYYVERGCQTTKPVTPLLFAALVFGMWRRRSKHEA